MRSMTLLAIVLLGAAAGAHAQDLERDTTWTVAFDNPAAEDTTLFFVDMPPGWHITTGPATLLYQSDSVAAGRYLVKAVIFEFPGPANYGLAYSIDGGGGELDYWSFRLDGTGRFGVVHHAGVEQHQIVPWTPHAAITQAGEEQPSKNILVLEAGTEDVVFYVNSTEVHRMPRGDLDLGGAFGLRVEDGTNLHVSQLTAVQLQ